MKDQSYFQLRALLLSREKQKSALFKLEELEEIWFCTRKNVKRKLKKLEEQQLLRYFPGKGRGNLSELSFVHDFQTEVETAVQEYMDKKQLEDIIHILQLPIPKAWIANVSKEVQELFGHQSPNDSKDILRTMITREITTLDPLFVSVTLESYLVKQLGDTLVVYDRESDTIKPHLAHHWLVDEQSMEWTFYIRKGVRFHHQGILTSEDVKSTFERFNIAASPQRWLTQDIVKIECPTTYTIKFYLKKPNPFFLRYISSINLVILPKDVPFDEYRWIGTGPFQLKERTDSKLILKAFEFYFLERPLLDEVEFWRVPMDPSRVTTYVVEKKNQLRTIADAKDTHLKKTDIEVGFRFLAFNFNRDTIVQSHSFRKAIFHLLDTGRMYQDLKREGFVEASSFFPWKSTTQKRDRSKVKEYLAQSDYRGETLTLFSLDFPKAMEEAEWIVEQAKLEGIMLRHVSFSINQFYSNTIDVEADLLLMGEVATLDHHLSFLGAFYNEALFFRRLLNKEQLTVIEESLEQFKFEPNSMKREYWMEKVESYLRDQQLILFQNHPIKNRVFHPMIQDIRFESFGYVDLQKLWIQ